MSNCSHPREGRHCCPRGEGCQLHRQPLLLCLSQKRSTLPWGPGPLKEWGRPHRGWVLSTLATSERGGSLSPPLPPLERSPFLPALKQMPSAHLQRRLPKRNARKPLQRMRIAVTAGRSPPHPFRPPLRWPSSLNCRYFLRRDGGGGALCSDACAKVPRSPESQHAQSKA